MKVSTISILGFIVVIGIPLVTNAFTVSRPSFINCSSITTANRISSQCNIRSAPLPVRTSYNNFKRQLRMVAESIEEITFDSEERMEKSIDSVKVNLSSIRTGRANAAILDRVLVNYYDVPTPLKQLAGISVPSAQQLTVEPYDKSSMVEIEKAIVEADLGITPNNDGTVIRINIPPLTEERRKELLKQVKAIGEEGKVAVRNIRRDGVDAIKKLEKNKTVGKDESLDGLDEMQKMTDKSIKEIDEIVAKKEKEVMTV